MGTWPCGMVVMVGELFGAESKVQVYGNIYIPSFRRIRML